MPKIIARTGTFLLSVFMLISVPLLAAAETPVGVWKNIDDITGQAKALIEISANAGVLQGRIVQLFRRPDEEQNPLCAKCSGAQHEQPVLGMTILTGLKKDGDEWNDGAILDPNNGKVYSCKITLIDGGTKLEVRGFIGISLFGRTQVWERQP
jgi:uncharacterized protein (DUF2147 family)